MTADSGTTQREVGELLVAQGKLTAPQLEQARRRQKRLNLPQHRAIVDLNFASEEDTWRALAEVNHFEFVDPAARDLKPEPEDLDKIQAKLKSGLPDDTSSAAQAEDKKPGGG